MFTKIIDDKSDSMDHGWVNDHWIELEVEGFGCGEKHFTDNSVKGIVNVINV